MFKTFYLNLLSWETDTNQKRNYSNLGRIKKESSYTSTKLQKLLNYISIALYINKKKHIVIIKPK